MNARILGALKKRVQGAKGRWAEHLPLALWDYHTTVRKAMGASPFSLVYGTEAMLSIETLVPSPRVLDHDEERRMISAINMAKALNLELHLREER